MEELYRRATVAAIHKAGTVIRKTEPKRIKMMTKQILGMIESLEKEIKDFDPLKRLAELVTAEDDTKALEGLFKFMGEAGAAPVLLKQISNIMDSVDNIRQQLEKEGIVFEFPVIEKPPILEVAKK